jgi:hypothetical protein
MNYIILGNKPVYEKDFRVENNIVQKLYSLRFRNSLNDSHNNYLINEMKFDVKEIKMNGFNMWSTIIYYNKDNNEEINIVKYIIDNLPLYWNSEFEIKRSEPIYEYRTH